VESVGRLLMLLGAAALIVGGLLRLFGNRLGHLPGDMRFGDSVFVPLGTCLLVSLVLTIVINVLARIFWR